MELFLRYFLSLSTVLCNIYVMLGMCDTDTIISGLLNLVPVELLNYHYSWTLVLECARICRTVSCDLKSIYGVCIF